MTNKKQYPEWQKAIREAQEEQRKAELQAEVNRMAEIAEKDREQAQKMRELLKTLTLNMPKDIVIPKWELDGYRFEYHFQKARSYSYGTQPSEQHVYIYKFVEGANYSLEEFDWDGDYRTEVSVDLAWANYRNDPTPADLADELDKLDKKAVEQVTINKRALEDRERRLNEPKTETTLTTEDHFLNHLKFLIAEMVNGIVTDRLVDY